MTGPVPIVPSDDVVRTYRYLRIALVGLVVLLATSVAMESLQRHRILGSISEYYYTPVRAVLVGVLVASGVCLIALKGRGIEDVLLNLAGMVAPVVALVPAPLTTETDGDLRRLVPQDAADNIDNNVAALLVTGAIVLVFSAWTALRRVTERRAALLGVLAGAALLAGATIWFAAGPESFRSGAHYAAAIVLFGIFTAVAWSQARSGGRRTRWYGVIACLMLVSILVAIVCAAFQAAGHDPGHSWMFWVEGALLTLFATFWTLQTIDYWETGLPIR